MFRGLGSILLGPPLSALHAALTLNPGVTLTSLNRLLYRCEPEERDDSGGARGCYDVPGMGRLAWAGLAGLAQPLRHCRRWNDMGHPLLANMRAGDWLQDFILTRLGSQPDAMGLQGVHDWLAAHFALVRRLPPGLKPQAMDRVLSTVLSAAVAAALHRMRSSPLLRQAADAALAACGAVPDAACGGCAAAGCASCAGAGGASPSATAEAAPQLGRDPSAPWPLATALALTSVQLWGHTQSSPLMALPLLEARPQQQQAASAAGATGAAADSGSGETTLVTAGGSLAAGVDHFAAGYMRIWGRDTFISLRGLLLATGRYEDARTTILAFATIVRHGLIPNLMDGGRNPRYNCRDAAWWFLQAVKDYCTMAPEGTGILGAPVHRRFPSDDPSHYRHDHSLGAPVYCGPGAEGSDSAGAGAGSVRTTLGAIVHEMLTRHASGIHFREWNAGSRIDEHMTDGGFNIDVWTDEGSGFIHGGNAWNCGTWMDKMGSSGKAGNKGQPATPRDGADIEIVALSYSVLAWLGGLAEGAGRGSAAAGAGSFTPAPAAATVAAAGLSGSVRFPSGAEVTYAGWAQRIAAAFHRHFYVPPAPEQDHAHAIDGRYVNRRGIYKDTVGSSAGWSDYQLRPNQLIAMAVAPELFPPEAAQTALAAVEQQLLGERQMGVKTLDPADWAYRGNYDNANDGTDKSVAAGWNYHQGPEWLWPYGYWLRARMRFPPPSVLAAAAAADATDATSGSSGGDRPAAAAPAPASAAAARAQALAPCAWPRHTLPALRRWMAGRLALQRSHLESSPDGGLPELTNAGGAFCRDSCTSQAWSSSTLLDALWDLQAHTHA
jgi:glycogen debranching enzyme